VPQERRAEIVRAALGMLAETGFDGLSLRRLAGHLGMHAPGLYWYIESKQELIDLMAKEILDTGLYPIAPLSPGQTWDDWLVELACTSRRALLAYRDGARVVASAYLVRTNAITPVIEQSLTILEEAGFERVIALGGTMTLLRYATGIALDEQASPIHTAPGMSMQERLATLPPPEIDARRWPRTADALRTVFDRNLRDPDRMFRLGAQMIVRGLAEKIESGPPSAR
jgi:TetR/AcrR family transcriptional regulator, tetracycline repressor protein